jgi:hypothetical protein
MKSHKIKREDKRGTEYHLLRMVSGDVDLERK